MKLRLILSGLIVSICVTPGLTQRMPPFEKVSLKELQMNSYPGDSTASAVILMDYGRLDGRELKFTRKMRVKILTKAGLDWGNWTFNTPSKGDFKVVTHNLEGEKIVSEEADSKSIHTEEIFDGFEVYKVFASNVRAGSVVDITYSHFGPPIEWRFQERIPTVASHLILEQTDFLNYRKTHFGFQPIETLSPTEWTAQNVPAFSMEPFLNTYSNYISKFEFQLESFVIRGVTYEFSTTWRKVIENLLIHPRFGGTINSLAFLNDFAKETNSKKLPVQEKIQAAYAYIQANMKWNGQNSLLASRDIRSNFLVAHTGSSADINLALICLLKKMDITTYPVVTSTRQNGLLVQFSPSISKLNYVVAYVQHEDIDLYLDATLENVAVPGILPARCQNGQGLLVKKDNEQWLSLNKGFQETKKQFITISVEKSGTAKAKVFHDFIGYGFLNWADEQKGMDGDPEVVKNKLQKSHPDINILTYEVTKKDTKAIAGKETIEVDLSDHLIDAGGDMILSPFLMYEYASNPFKAEERIFPVDMTYPREFSTTIVVQLPKEVAVKQLPPSVKFTNADGSASFMYMASAAGSAVQLRAVLKLNKYVFTESEYKDLRMFFSEVVKKINTPIELSKT